jgi:hypothetical protein
MHALWEQMWDISGGMPMDPVEVLAVGRGRYVVMMASGIVGKLSRADVAGTGALLYTLRDGLSARLDVLADREAALAAAGLRG